MPEIKGYSVTYRQAGKLLTTLVREATAAKALEKARADGLDAIRAKCIPWERVTYQDRA